MKDNSGNTLEEKKPAKDGGSAKKLYTKHTLTIYGTIRDLTKTVGATGPADGGTFTGMQQSQF